MEKYQSIEFYNDNDIYKYNLKFNISRGTLITAHTADLHFPVFDPKLQYQILKEQFIDILYKLPKLDIVFINGDIFDHKLMSSSEGVMYACMTIADLVELCRIKQSTLILLHGTYSHDSNQLKLFYHYMADHSVDIRIVTKIQFEIVKGSKVLCIPEMYGVDESVYSDYLFYSGLYDLCVMHGMFQGAVAGDESNSRLFKMSDFCNCRGPIIAGHVHKPGCFDNYFYYTGSPYRWRFDDDHDKGFIIMTINLDNGYHYCHFNEIKSFIYRTINLNDIISEDPRVVIDYIKRLKDQDNIDFIKIRFDVPVSGSNKTILNNFFRNSENIFIEFLDKEKEDIKKRENEIASELDEYSFILDESKSYEEIFCMYANMKKGYEFITVNEFIDILSSNI